MAESARGLFVTGTDTGVGKTVVGCALVRALDRQGVRVAVRKPVESGCEIRDEHLYPADGSALQEAAGSREPLECVTPIRLAHAVSPERAAQLEGVTLTGAMLHAACADAGDSDFVLVEGAGGFLSPLAADTLNADLARALALPVLVVVADRLGCINHALLTVEAIRHRGLELAAIVVNAVTAEVDGAMANRDDLASRLECPVLSFAYGDDPGTADELARRLVYQQQRTTDERR